jgi:large subunit ribosomal protein L13
MKTIIPKMAEVTRKWYLIDAKGKAVGKVATEAAVLLRGKNKVTFTPHLDLGDGVVIVNAKEVSFSGWKWLHKKYYRHSGYPGGLKTIPAEEMREKNPEEILRHAIAGMIPRNRLKKDVLLRLRIVVGTDHGLDSQKPEPVSI